MPRGTVQTALVPQRGRTSLAEVMKVAMRAAKIGIRTTIPCTVESYNPITQKVSVIAGHVMVLNTDAGVREQEPLKVPGCPVHFASAASGSLTMALKSGDTGMLLVSDRSLEQWMNKTPVVDAVDPAANHTHNIIDGIFLPGLHPTTAPIPLAATSGVILDGVPTLKFGPLATRGVARLADATAPNALMLAWMTAITTAWNLTQPAGGPILAPSGTPLVLPTTLGAISTASEKVRSE